ncbi:SOS response-associated peptidase (plasmid) [Moraxella osloensis]|uniref:Abasic site processing protein n=1 Tax=Faucicola osloensis TaxID=34062 RepID=A0A6P1KLU5_FAUOS|nr:SOS response-associated peptidase family protein [Moraxella osloensis]QHG10833.1 SOS response-associated peptidase [Moraxella osloensis]
MCANFQPITQAQASRFTNQQLSFEFKDEIYPGYDAPILFANIGDPAEWRSAIFGMIPKWAKDTSFAKHTYNARSETVADKPSFKHAWFNNQFALIPVQTIYEPFTVAALYEIVKIGEQIVRSMTMLTTNADNHPFMLQFHKPEDEKRSIVVIEPEHRQDWLDMHHEDAFELLKPMGAGYVAEHLPKPSKTHDSAPNDDLLDLLLPKS